MTTTKALGSLLPLWLAVAAPLAAQEPMTPYPEFTGGRVYVAGVADQYSPLASDIDGIEAGSPQTYYIVAVQSAGPGEFAAQEYADELFKRWRTEAGMRGLSLDGDRSILIVLAEGNRALAVRPGAALQEKYGLRGQLIDRELVAPHFIPHARGGDYAAGLKALLTAIEGWIEARDAALEQERQLALARAEEIRRNAAAVVAAAAALATEGRGELAAKQQTGLDLASLATTIDEVAERLPAIEALVAGDAPAALAQGQAAQQQLQQALDQIRQLAAQQVEAIAQLVAVGEQMLAVEESIRDLARQELAFGPVQAELDAAVELVAAAERNVNANPREALSLSQQAENRLKAARYAAAESAVLKEEVDKKSVETVELAAAVAAELAAAQGIGASVADEAAEVAEAQRQLAAAGELRKSDYRQAMRTLDTSKRKLTGLRRDIASAQSTRLLLTRKIPLGVVAVLLAVAAAVFGLRLRKYAAARKATSDQLAAFKLRVVQFLDRLDLVKQRHQLLPFSDEDYSQPMQGATLALYNDTEAVLALLRETWLEWMETGNGATRLVDGQRFLGTSRFDEAQKLLAAVPPQDQIEADLSKCNSEIDRLEQAHEQAEPLLAAADAGAAGERQRIDALRAAQLATAPYERELAACRALAEQGRAMLAADPILARQTLEQEQSKRTALAAWIESVERQLAAAHDAAGKLDTAAQAAVQHRATGLKLVEDDGNPDPILARGRKEHAAALAALQKADAETAARHAEAAAGHAAEATQLIERQVAARKQVQADIPLRRSEMQRLRGSIAGAAAAREQLAREHASSAWSGVAEAVPAATSLLDRLDGVLSAAEQTAGDDRQHYFAATESLVEVAAGQQQTSSLLAAVGQRLKELTELRERGRKQLGQLAAQEREASDFAARHEQALSLDALARLAAAATVHRAAVTAQQAERPDWPALVGQMDLAATALKAACDAAAEEVRRHEQLLSQLEVTDRLQKQVGHLLAGNTADRPRANQRYQAACQALAAVAQQSAAPHGDWQRLLGQVQEAAGDFKNAEQWAQEDIRLAQQAAAAILDAEKHFQQVRTFYSGGVAADAHAAEQQLVQARQRFSAQAYEQAVSLADAAERAAREAYDRATAAVRERERRRDELRRRSVTPSAVPSLLDAIGTLGGSFGGHGSGGGSGGASHGHSASPPATGTSSSSWSGSSGTSSSSWSSGTSQSKW